MTGPAARMSPLSPPCRVCMQRTGKPNHSRDDMLEAVEMQPDGVDTHLDQARRVASPRLHLDVLADVEVAQAGGAVAHAGQFAAPSE
ncbi:hypothetical protein Dda_8666 [Drechslerella dactyloides]|uniref:Uncharacterized protein n=1 Tax=Drechslerella dactyloides TaxID=74499 RepID=A0AAD6IR16_DREDA|nr:hypothetical protein Dda_8666 [Drechslerella dactyloides]